MPPRIRTRPLHSLTTNYICIRCASTATATATSPSTVPSSTRPNPQHSPLSVRRFSPINPPSHRDPVHRKSQLLRQYVSLIRTTPLIILFQHNNLKALEWASIRRELAVALQKVDETLVNQSGDANQAISDAIKLTVIRTNIFEPALRIAEYYKPDQHQVRDGETDEVAVGVADEKLDPGLTHALSENAYLASREHMGKHELTPLLNGSIALLNFPVVSPAHVKAALQILSPKAPAFPAPTRRANPGYYSQPVQEGLAKLLMLGARVDGRVFDTDGVRYVGSIDGFESLRAQLVGMLQGFAGGLAQTLESASRNLWVTVEGRRKMLEDESKPAEEKKDEPAA